MNSINLSSSYPSLSPSLLSSSPSHYHQCLSETTKHSKFVAIVLKCTIDPLMWIFQSIFYTIHDCLKDRNSLYRTERASLNHMGAYINQFNKESHRGLFMNPNFCMLEENGEDWNQPSKGSKSLFDRITTSLSEEHFKKADLTGKDRLRYELRESHKDVLAMLINVNKRHWTVIHFNFKDSTISYVDSNGAHVGNEKTRKLIDARLLQAHAWIQNIDSETWKINQNVATKSPSMLTHKIQYDSYNCGAWVMQVTSAISSRKTYHDISNTSFEDNQHHVSARRLHMMNFLKDL